MKLWSKHNYTSSTKIVFSISYFLHISCSYREKMCDNTAKSKIKDLVNFSTMTFVWTAIVFFIAEEDKVNCNFQCFYREVRHEKCLRWSLIRAQHDTRWSFLIQHPTRWYNFIFKTLHVSQFLYRNPTFCIIFISKTNTLKNLTEKCVTI